MKASSFETIECGNILAYRDASFSILMSPIGVAAKVWDNLITRRTSKQPQVAKNIAGCEVTSMAAIAISGDYVKALLESTLFSPRLAEMRCVDRTAVVLATGEAS